MEQELQAEPVVDTKIETQEADPVATQQAEPVVEIDNNDFKLSTMPKSKDDYPMDKAIVDSVAYDQSFHKKFDAFAFGENLNLGQYRDIVDFWEANAKDFDGDVDKLAIKFSKVAHHLNLSAETVVKLKAFLTNDIRRSNAEIKKTQAVSAKIRGNPGSETRAALINAVKKSSAYANRGNTPTERTIHKEAIRVMNELTQGRNPFKKP